MIRTKNNITLIHCYSDLNMGDAGIILGTIRLLREIGDVDTIKMVSTFSAYDKKFSSEHFITAPASDGLSGALFPEPYLKFGNKYHYSTIAKMVSFILLLPKYIVLYFIINNKTLSGLLLNNSEKETLKTMRHSSLIISKGGSFLYCFKGLRASANFLRMIYPFFILKKLGKKVVILGQSFGPYETKLSGYLIKWILRNFSSIYFRETETIRYLQNKELIPPSFKPNICPDLAFNYRINNKSNSGSSKYFGITARPHVFNNKLQWKNYIDTLVNNIVFITKKYNYKVILIPQVTSLVPVDNDMNALKIIYEELVKHIDKDQIYYPQNIKSIEEIKKIYCGLEFLIATRLHSAIFALSEEIPAIAISYHGTKSTGIMKSLGLGEFCLDIHTITEELLREKITSLLMNREKYINTLQSSLVQINNQHNGIKKRLHELITVEENNV